MPPDARIPLQQVRIASPCHMKWEDMAGDDKARFCDACSLHVHNTSAMTDSEVRVLLARAAEGGGRVCARLFQRADGTILLRDCPVGLRAAAVRVTRMGLRAAAALAMLVGLGAALGAQRPSRLASLEPFRWLASRLNPSPPPAPLMGKVIMGEVCVPTPRVVPAPNTGVAQ